MQTIVRSTFSTVKTEGGLLPADLLQRIAGGDAVTAMRPEDYHLLPGERLNERINQSWNRCLSAWRNFDHLRQTLADDDTGTTLTRERWLLPLFQELGYGRLQAQRGGLPADDGEHYPISHVWTQTPIHLVTFRQDLDRRSPVETQVRRTPHSLMQEFLNRARRYQWGIIANGLQLRLLRDNASLRRAAYVEFDLEAMFTGELYAEFTLLWLVCHQSRVEPRPEREIAAAQAGKPAPKKDPGAATDTDDADETEAATEAVEEEEIRHTCWLEVWSALAEDQGTRARDALRDGVATAIEALGTGFLQHPANGELRRRLQTGDLPGQSFYHQLRRQVYRLIFLYVAEDRDLLLLPGTDPTTRRRYEDYYSLGRLRAMAGDLRGSPHGDLYRQVSLLFTLLRTGYAPLGLPGLGSFLFSPRATPDLDDLELRNRDLLAAIWTLVFTEDKEERVRRLVDYRNLDSEELGSVYESLLELHPQLDLGAGTLTLTSGAGSERKTTGSHYTPTPLVQSLLDTALEPVIAARLAAARNRTQINAETTQIEPDTDPRSSASFPRDQRSINPAHQTQQRTQTNAETTQIDTDNNPQLSASFPRNQRSINPLADAILSIKVIDYAAGSGHMLIGAGRRLAQHLARVETGDEEPAPEAVRGALRRVVSHCLYGVDMNDTAVELCKIALWMETLEPGKPLGFLDKNIQCGNSLIGVTPHMETDEVPDGAFQPQTGDDRATATALRKRNKREREGQLSLGFHVTRIDSPEDLAAWRARQLAQLGGEDRDVQAVQRKEAAFQRYLESDAYRRGRLEYDLWTAAFFWPIPQGDAESMVAPTQQALVELRAGQTLDAELMHRVESTAAQHQFFHWSLAFPDVFAREQAGFDVVLSNPPWERIKLQEKEWFATRRPDIANAANAAARRRLIDGLATEDPALHAAFQDARFQAESQSHFVRNSDKFPLCGRGDVNTYAIFAELARQVICPPGRTGIIVPSGIATDDTTKFFFQDIMETHALVTLYDFENRRKIFPAVDSRVKFCLLTLRGTDDASRITSHESRVTSHASRITHHSSRVTSNDSPVTREAAEFVFFALEVDDLNDPDRRFTLTAEEIALLNPNTRTCPIFRSRRDAELTKAIYRRVPVLIKEGDPDENPWGISFLRMFDMANDSHLFRTRAELEADGWRLEGNVFVTSPASRITHHASPVTSDESRVTNHPPRYLPLYEAKMFHHFDHRWATYDGDRTRDITLAEKMDPACVALPRYWVKEAEVENKAREHSQGWFCVFRDIARSTDERTAIFTLIPKTAVGNKAPLLISSDYPVDQLHIASCSASFVFDFVCRQSIGGITLNFYIVKQLALLPPEAYAQPCPWAGHPPHPTPDTPHPISTLAAWLLPRVLELTYTAWDLLPFAQDVLAAMQGDESRVTSDQSRVTSHASPVTHHESPVPPPFRWDEDRRFLLRCELDAAYFHLYGIARDDVAYILDTFPIVKRKDLAAHGEYRTQRVILEIYDELAHAMQTGTPYQTRLDPPPADPRVAHGSHE